MHSLNKVVLFALSLAGCLEDELTVSPALDTPRLDPPSFHPEFSALACDPLTTPRATGFHHPGTACLGCHNGSSAQPLTLAGTLFESATSERPVAGATLYFFTQDSRWLELTTAGDGNFWATEPLAFPVQTAVSVCPSISVKPRGVRAPGADCNVGGCHGAGQRIF